MDSEENKDAKVGRTKTMRYADQWVHEIWAILFFCSWKISELDVF